MAPAWPRRHTPPDAGATLPIPPLRRSAKIPRSGRKQEVMEVEGATGRAAVGVGAIVRDGDLLLLMRRAQPHGRGTWSTPGGFLEAGESFEECAARETREEVGLDVSGFRFVAVTNDLFEDGRHCLTVWMCGDLDKAGSPDPTASEEVAELRWFRLDDLPSNRFVPFANLVDGVHYPPRAPGSSLAAALPGS